MKHFALGKSIPVTVALLVCASTATGVVVRRSITPASKAVSAPKVTGRIAFDCERDGNRDIYLMNADGTGESRLTNDPALDNDPTLSPDGTKIAFTHLQDDTPQICIINSDGTGLRCLTTSETGSDGPAFSADGKSLIYTSAGDNESDTESNSEIYIMNVDGSRQRRLTYSSIKAADPVFSPDGRLIVFCSFRNDNRDIYLINVDGSHQRRLTSGAANNIHPIFTPDGQRILFVSDRANPNSGGNAIYSMKVDGKDVRRVTPPQFWADNPSFSPDGRKIVFDSGIFAPGSSLPHHQGIYTMNPDGTGRTLVAPWADADTFRSHPTWGKGSRITAPIKVAFPTPTPLAELPLDVVPQATPHNDAFEVQPSTPSPLQGRIAYLFDSDTSLSSSSTRLFGLLSIGRDDSDAPPNTTTRTNDDVEHQKEPHLVYHARGLKGNFRVDFNRDAFRNPRFSPDGRYVLVQSEQSPAGSNPIFRAYVWDIAGNRLRPLSKRLLNGSVSSWSPDGRYLLYTVLDNDFSLRLVVCEWKTQTTRSVARVDTQSGAQAFNNNWLSSDTLLYTLLPQTKPQQNTNQSKGAKSILRREKRPSIYAVSVVGSKARLSVEDGQRPTASPDGQHIAFFGSEDPNKPFPLNDDWNERPGGASLCIARSDGTERKALTREGGSYPFVIWEPDSRHLLTIKAVPDAPSPQSEIKEWDMTTGRFRRITTLQGTIKPLQVSTDGKFLLIAATPIFDSRKEQETHLLQAVDLKTGAISMLARFKGDAGFDWHDSATP